MELDMPGNDEQQMLLEAVAGRDQTTRGQEQTLGQIQPYPRGNSYLEAVSDKLKDFELGLNDTDNLQDVAEFKELLKENGLHGNTTERRQNLPEGTETAIDPGEAQDAGDLGKAVAQASYALESVQQQYESLERAVDQFQNGTVEDEVVSNEVDRLETSIEFAETSLERTGLTARELGSDGQAVTEAMRDIEESLDQKLDNLKLNDGQSRSLGVESLRDSIENNFADSRRRIWAHKAFDQEREAQNQPDLDSFEENISTNYDSATTPDQHALEDALVSDSEVYWENTNLAWDDSENSTEHSEAFETLTELKTDLSDPSQDNQEVQNKLDSFRQEHGLKGSVQSRLLNGSEFENDGQSNAQSFQGLMEDFQNTAYDLQSMYENEEKLAETYLLDQVDNPMTEEVDTESVADRYQEKIDRALNGFTRLAQKQHEMTGGETGDGIKEALDEVHQNTMDRLGDIDHPEKDDLMQKVHDQFIETKRDVHNSLEHGETADVKNVRFPGQEDLEDFLEQEDLEELGSEEEFERETAVSNEPDL